MSLRTVVRGRGNCGQPHAGFCSADQLPFIDRFMFYLNRLRASGERCALSVLPPRPLCLLCPKHGRRLCRTGATSAFRPLRCRIRGSNSDPDLCMRKPKDRRAEAQGTSSVRRRPCAPAAVRGHHGVLKRLGILRIIAAHSHAVPGIGKRQREYARRCPVIANGRICHIPGAARVCCVEDAACTPASGTEPRLPLASQRETRITGSESAFLRLSLRRVLTVPVFATIGGGEDCYLPRDGIARNNSVSSNPKTRWHRRSPAHPDW